MITLREGNYQLIYAPDLTNIFVLEDTCDELKAHRVQDLKIVGKILMYQFNAIYGV